VVRDDLEGREPLERTAERQARHGEGGFVSAAIVVKRFVSDPADSAVGLGIVALGIPVYYFSGQREAAAMREPRLAVRTAMSRPLLTDLAKTDQALATTCK